MGKNLFNEKTINRNISKIEPTIKQKTASKKWIELLEKDQLQEEVFNYPKFMIYILQDLLGYDITSFKHEEKNMEFPFKDKSGNFLVCFEAKGTKTKDLWALQGRSIKIRETPVNQINDYLYKNKIPYGILTNYREFVLFKREEGYTKFHKIDFLDIKKNSDKLKEFIFIFSRESFEKDDPTKLYKNSVIEERNLTKEFYKLYHETRLMILKEFKESGLENEICLHYSQLFLNRLMFIFFAEDTDLLDKRYFENRLLEVLDKSSGIIDGYTSYIFGKIRSIFRELDKEIPKQIKGFNGELFKEEIDGRLSFKDYRNKPFFNDVKQNYKLDKEIVLYEDDKKIFNKHKNRISKIIENILLLASFDFKSEVNVNILGHIFEQSISDIENLKEEKVSKRKKEGVFYTPEYVTEYICRNTIIPYLSKNGTSDINELIDEYSRDIEELEKKFKSIKILDPACGSGAFLIKSTEILFEIFEKIQFVKENYGEYEASRGLKRKSNFKGQLTFKKWNEKDEIKNIIENNIFGVDINEESVEITKLALFLKIARKNKKLIDLSNNIKQGNSLVDDKNIDKRAFNWENEFPFKFDVIVGNPPYVDSENMTRYNKEERDYLSRKYKTTKGNWDLYIPFIEKAFNLLNENGRASMITPNKWLSISYGNAIRNFVGKHLYQLSDYLDIQVFEDAGIFPIIFFISKKECSNLNIKRFYGENKSFESTIKKKALEGFDNFGIFFSKNIKIIMKLLKDNKPLGSICNLSGAFTTSEAYDLIPLLEDKEFDSENYLKFVNTGTIDSYFPLWGFQPTKYLKKEYIYPVVSKQKFKKYFNKRYERFNKPKIIISGIRHFECFYDENNKYLAGKSTSVLVNLNGNINYNSINCILNSKLITFYLKEVFSSSGMGGGINFSPAVISTIPIPKINEKIQKELIEKSRKIFNSYKEFYETRNNFIKLIKYKYNLDKISRKLENFYNLNFKEFVNEIQNKNKIMSMEKEAELMDFFEKNKKEVLELVNEIYKTEREIDEMVYELYGLTDKEIEVIEKS
jgi:hypothetical protein